MSLIRLFYFEFPGRGELVRLVLTVAGVEFDDVRISFADWPAKYKPEAPFGQLPYVEYHGKKYSQSVAIATFFAQKNGLYGDNNLEALRIDEVVGLVQDFIRVFITAFAQKDPAKKPQSVTHLAVHSRWRGIGLPPNGSQMQGTWMVEEFEAALPDGIAPPGD